MRVYGDLLSICDSCKQQNVDVGRYLLWAAARMYQRYKERYPQRRVQALARWEYIPLDRFTAAELNAEYAHFKIKTLEGRQYLRVNQYDRHVHNDFDTIDVSDLSIGNYLKKCRGK